MFLLFLLWVSLFRAQCSEIPDHRPRGTGQELWPYLSKSLHHATLLHSAEAKEIPDQFQSPLVPFTPNNGLWSTGVDYNDGLLLNEYGLFPSMRQQLSNLDAQLTNFSKNTSAQLSALQNVQRKATSCPSPAPTGLKCKLTTTIGCYCVSTSTADYFTALTTCNKAKLRLLSIPTPSTQTALTSELAAEDYWTSGYFYPYVLPTILGQTFLLGVWRWNRGNNLDVTYSNWAPNEVAPNTAIELCLTLQGTNSFLWTSDDCTVKKKFVCLVPSRLV